MAGLSQRHETHGKLEEHVRLMRAQVQKSLDDPATRVLAAAIISGNFDSAVDKRTGVEVPVVPYYGRWYRGAESWDAARSVCGMRDYDCSIVALWNVVVLNLLYFQDQDGEDSYSTVRATFEQGGGDCDDLAIVFAAFFKAVGFENVIFRIVSVAGTQWDHVYCCVMLPDGRWIACDPTEKGNGPGWEARGMAAKRDFAV